MAIVKNTAAAQQIITKGADPAPAVESDLLAPEDDMETAKVGEIKQGVINSAPTKTHFLKVPGLTGMYGKVLFDDDNVSTDPVGDKDTEKIRERFPMVEELSERPIKATPQTRESGR